MIQKIFSIECVLGKYCLLRCTQNAYYTVHGKTSITKGKQKQSKTNAKTKKKKKNRNF